MGFFIGMTVGLVLGGLMTAFVIGASRVNHENEIYADGHIQGYAEGYKAGYGDAKKKYKGE